MPVTNLTPNEVKRLVHQVEILIKDVEGWRVHTSSTGEFLQIALEELVEAVRELAAAVGKR